MKNNIYQKLNPKNNKKLSYLLDLFICAICLFILPNYILPNHPIASFITCFVIAIISCKILGAFWRPWKSIK